jgi:uncharacterized membrane protein HdeD (DUF308 family)
MSDSHSEKYFAKLLIGFASIISSIFVIFYAFFESGAEKGDWYFWAIVAAFLMCGGVYFALTAFVHKVKSEFSKRTKQRESQKANIND